MKISNSGFGMSIFLECADWNFIKVDSNSSATQIPKELNIACLSMAH